MPLAVVIPIVLVVALTVAAWALRQAEGHAAELREALIMLVMLAAVSAGVGLFTLCLDDASNDIVHVTAGSVSA